MHETHHSNQKSFNPEKFIIVKELRPMTTEVYLKNLKPGDKVVTDGGFTCMPESVIRTVFADEIGNLYICCDEGRHYLDGQEDFDDPENKPLVGLRTAVESS